MSDTAQFERASLLLPRAHKVWLRWLCLASAATSVLMCLLQPAHHLAWMGAAGLLPAVLFAFKSVPSINETLVLAGPSARLSLARSLVGVGVLIFAALLLRLTEVLGWMDIAEARRLLGALLGGGLLLVGRLLPARLLPFVTEHLPQALASSLLEFLGATMMYAGAFYALIWSLFPVADANLWASCWLVLAVLVAGYKSIAMVQQHNS